MMGTETFDAYLGHKSDCDEEKLEFHDVFLMNM